MLWTPAIRKVADQAIESGSTDQEVAELLETKGLDHDQAIFRSVNRRSRLMREAIKSGNGDRAAWLSSKSSNATTTTTIVQQQTIEEEEIREIVRQEVACLPSQKRLDGEQICDLIRAELRGVAAQNTTTIEIKRPDGVTTTIEGAHYLMPRLLRLLGAGIPVYLWGPAGTGKTTAALQASKALGRESEIDTLDPSTFRSMVQGYRTPEGEPVHTAFSRCWCESKTYIADETDNAPGHVQTLFNSALANGHAPLAWGSVERSEGFSFIGTGNTPGRPTRAFPDRRPMSGAFADRLYFVYWPLDEAIECRSAGIAVPSRPSPSQDTCSAQDWCRWVQAVRAYAEKWAPTVQVTPRATIQGIKALALGETPADAADGLVFRGCDEELKNKILSACPLPGGDK